MRRYAIKEVGDLFQASVANILDTLTHTIRQRREERLEILLQPAKRASDDHVIKFKHLTICGLDTGRPSLRGGFAVNLRNASPIVYVCTIDGWLGDLLQNLVICACAKEIFCRESGEASAGGRSIALSLTTLYTLLKPEKLEALHIERATNETTP